MNHKISAIDNILATILAVGLVLAIHLFVRNWIICFGFPTVSYLGVILQEIRFHRFKDK